MAAQRTETFDLSTVSAGTPIIVPLGTETPLNLVSVQVTQTSVSATGVIFKLVQSNNSTNWTDITDDSATTYTHTTTSTTEVVYLSAEYLRFAQAGLSIDVGGATTGTLEITFVYKSWR